MEKGGPLEDLLETVDVLLHDSHVEGSGCCKKTYIIKCNKCGIERTYCGILYERYACVQCPTYDVSFIK